MARYKGPNKFSGSIGDLTYTEDGVVKAKSSLDKRKWKKKASMKLTRRSAKEFGGANATSGAVIKSLPQGMRALARKFAHNHLAGKIAAIIREEPHARRDRIDFELCLPALYQLDLSRCESLSRKLQVKTEGSPLQPTAIHIQGLREMADSIPPIRNHRLKFALQFAFVGFPETYYCESGNKWRFAVHACGEDLSNDGWLDPDWVPREGLRLGIQNPDPNQPAVLFMAVQWMHSPVGKPSNKAPKETEMNEWGVVRAVALFRAVADAHLPVPPYLQPTRNQHFVLRRKTYRRHKLPKPTPGQKLKMLLTRRGLGMAKPRITFLPPRNPGD